MSSKYFILGLLVLSGIGWAQGPASSATHTEVRLGLSFYQAVIQANRNAVSKDAWELSPLNPHHFSPELKSRYSEEAICTAFLRAPREFLELVENEPNFLSMACFARVISEVLDTPEAKLRSQNTTTRTFTPVVVRRAFGSGEVLRFADLAPKQIAITFDDGPHPTLTQEVLDTLRSFHAPAIFFLVGNKTVARPDLVHAIADAGHGIGSHSWDHSCLGLGRKCSELNNGRILPVAEAVEQIRSGHQAVIDVLGFIDPFFRFPYGGSRSALRSYLQQNRIGDFNWSVDSNDWRSQTDDEFLRSVLASIRSAQSGIVLFHDIQRKTVRALPTILRSLHDEGFSLVKFEPVNSANERLR